MRFKVILLFFIIIFSIQVMASSDDDHGHSFWGSLFSQVLNSTLLFGGIIFLSRKHIIKFFTQKSLDAKNTIVLNEKSIKEKSEELGKLKNRLDKIEKEIERIKTIAKEKGEQESKKIEELGKKEAEKILLLTEAEIDNKVESSIKKLKSKIADLTIDHFKKDIESRLDDELHSKIVDENIKRSGEIIERE